MQKRWKIAFYEDEDGNNPVRDYLFDGKNETDLSVILNVIQRLSRSGQYLLDTNMARRLVGDLYELRKDRHRIIYALDGNRFVLLSAFLKKTQKTPPKELRRARRYLEEYRKTGRCLEFDIPDSR